MMRQDWIEIELGKIAKIFNGNSINARLKEEKYKVCKTGLNYIGTKDVAFDGNIEYENGVRIPFDEPKFKIAPKGCVLVCSEGGSAGRKTGYIEEDVCFGNKLFAITNEYSVFEGKYVYYYTRYRKFFQEFKNQLNGIIGGVSAKKFSNIKIDLSPLPEQRAIVAKIEELFSDLDKGIADLKKAQDQLKVYRQAVLKKGFEGLDEVPFDQLVTSSQNGMAKRRGTEGSETKVLRLADITNLEIDNSSPRSIILTPKEHEKYQLHEGDLLAIRVNGSIDLVGRFIHVTKKDESENWAFCDHLIRVTLDEERAVSKFYFYFFQLPKVRKFIHENMVSSAGQNTVSQGTVKAISVPTTALEEQHHIVQEIESRLSVCDKVEESITESLEKATALRQSILKKAFEGTLLSAEELAACKAAPDYKPASVLLEKIKAEKKK